MRAKRFAPSPLSDRLARRLRGHVEGPVRFDALTRGLYATDASIYQVAPLGVVLPRTLDDVDATMAIAREEGVPVLPRGAGTSQCGQTVGRAVVVDTSRHLNRVLEVDRDDRTATVEPGLVLDHLNRRLAPTGLFFPVDVATASRATIGGMAGNNSGGARSIRYGIMADNVLAIEATLADGRVATFDRGESGQTATAPELAETLRRIAAREADELEARVPGVLRHVAGYMLHRLLRPGASLAEALVGSEGTLAFFRELKLKLVHRPTRRVPGRLLLPVAARGAGLGATHRGPGTPRGRAGRSHRARARPRECGFSRRRRGAHPRVRPHRPARRVRGRRGRGAVAASRSAGRCRARHRAGPRGLPRRGSGRPGGDLDRSQGGTQHRDVDEGRAEAGLDRRGLRDPAPRAGRIRRVRRGLLRAARDRWHLVRARFGGSVACASVPQHEGTRRHRRLSLDRRGGAGARPCASGARTPASTATASCAPSSSNRSWAVVWPAPSPR